jgi:hypothetical protein
MRAALLAFLFSSTMVLAQGVVPLARVLDFEDGKPGSTPPGWNAPANTAFVDNVTVHGGKASARIERHRNSPGQFSGILYSMPLNAAGESIELRGYLRTADLSGVAAMWMRIDTPTGSAGFATTEGLGVTGTNDWKEYRISLPLKSEGHYLFFGVLLTGSGTIWADDLQLLVDGRPIMDAPKRPVMKTALEEDTEFDAGSRIPPIRSLSTPQAQNLVTLGKVWGFLKYHHPVVTSGKRHWDYELFRILPKILAAPDRDSANAALLRWIDALGEIPACQPCATLRGDELHLRPDATWIDDKAALGADLSRRLRAIYDNRPASGMQFYVNRTRGASNPSFDRELAYSGVSFPDAGVQLLTLYRFWNIIRYWFPYRDQIGENWDNVLADVLPGFALARDADGFQREVLKLIVRVNDTHAGLSGSPARPPQGTCQIPVVTRFIGDRAVVANVIGEAGATSGMKPGDIIAEIDGKPVSTIVKEWWPYYAASNEPTRLRDIGRSLPRGTCGPATVRIQRGAELVEVKTERATAPNPPPGRTHDLPGDTFQRLSSEIAYLKLSSVKIDDVPKYIDSANGTKGLIIDIRNYPSEFVVFALGSLLVERPTEFARFTMAIWPIQERSTSSHRSDWSRPSPTTMAGS